MMVETITEHSRFVSLFNAAAEEGKRKAIYSLSYHRMLASVRALSKQSLDKCPAIQGVCHYASKALNEENLADGADHQVLDISGQGGEYRHSEKAGGPRARDRRGVLDHADGS
ncbi:hypothetical protein WN51_10310 [Melipona quadrifasciata]|uniref:Uncharacterized protein n=1 Tax=Melipona quadrifasciata TaxID=166423 RepID=A0A0M9A4R7_9HYME|nr:hypothetical protein WN51_10310 [Melipona quadrifasciata]